MICKLENDLIGLVGLWPCLMIKSNELSMFANRVFFFIYRKAKR